MPLQVTIKESPGKVTLAMVGQFDFGSHRDFRRAGEACLKAQDATEIELNLSGVDYLDSSALGMMLLLQEKATGQGKKVFLMNVRGEVLKTLQTANFDKFFSVRA